MFRIAGRGLTNEKKARRALTGVVGIPVMCVIIFAFLRRKSAMCEEKYGISECRPHPARFAILAFAISLCVYGMLKVRRIYFQCYNIPQASS